MLPILKCKLHESRKCGFFSSSTQNNARSRCPIKYVLYKWLHEWDSRKEGFFNLYILNCLSTLIMSIIPFVNMFKIGIN